MKHGVSIDADPANKNMGFKWPILAFPMYSEFPVVDVDVEVPSDSAIIDDSMYETPLSR